MSFLCWRGHTTWLTFFAQNSLVCYPNENKPSSPWVRHLTNNSQNLFTVWTNILMSMYFTLNEIYCMCYKPILMSFSYVFHTEEVIPHNFLFHWNSTSWHLSCWGCTTHLPFSLKIHESALFLAEVAPHNFLFHSQTVWLGAKGIASKSIPCAFLSPKGIPHGSMQAKMWAKMWETMWAKHKHTHPPTTQLQHLSPLP